MSRLLTVLTAMVVVSGVAACSPTESSAPSLHPHTDRKGPVGPVPAELARFYGQPLSWGPCGPYATSDDDRATFQDRGLECARLTVPLDYAHPQGPTATLGLLRKPATDAAERIGSLVMNPGGPGASGMSSAAGMTDQVSASGVGKRFDLVGFDPRGIAASQPQARCLTDREWDGARTENDSDSSPSGVEHTQREEQEYATKCAQRTPPALLANMGTRDVVKDMDVLRSALGDPRLNFLGYSYGTRIGSEYARQFPRNVRAMVLDGAIDPTQSTNDESISQGVGFQKAFDAFAGWCAHQDSCALGRDPKHAVAEFQRLTRQLLSHPVPVGDGRQLSYKDATTAATQALYSQSLWRPLNTGMAQLSHGRGDMLMKLADSYYERSNDGRYANITDAYNAVRCVDDPRMTDPAAQRASDARYRQVAPFLDDGQQPSSALDTCSYWPVPPTGKSPQQPQNTGAPPPLVISTTGDPATPYQSGVNLANAMHGGLLTFDSTQHTAFLQGNSCVDDAATRYLTDGVLPDQGTRCGE